jgi:2-polyprenyl-3-methyl-5-hydroxy-6-metoxy-1,4-benzoquinol methylase
VQNLKPTLTWESEVTKFENFVQNQKPASPAQDFDENYFVGEWRHGNQSYTLNSRREIEGRNPNLIKSVLSPKNVLDAGCGPGFLMLMLHELGVDVAGIDAAPAAVAGVPDEINNRIQLGSVLNLPFQNQEFDVVISREVLEHLTVIEVAKAVREMCRVSSRLVYITTRFAREANSIFDVETEFEADPTHITCMNKSLLRTFLILEGFKARPDLESEMDWMKKDRALVYERTEKVLI